jgi:hypothetical protein
MRNKVSLPIGKDDNSSEIRYIKDKNTDLHAAVISVNPGASD